jgi:hypothetical protein
MKCSKQKVKRKRQELDPFEEEIEVPTEFPDEATLPAACNAYCSFHMEPLLFFAALTKS